MTSGPSTASAEEPGPDGIELSARAKLTLSLRVTGVRSDGYHLLESEMVTLDLADTLVIGAGDELTVSSAYGGGEEPWRTEAIDVGPSNLVTRALAVVERTAHVELVKRIPPGSGLGGGSADAAAVLRWSGSTDVGVAASLGADVPFCVRGGRALVRGVGEDLTRLPFEERTFTLFLLPLGVDTGAVYRAWDRLVARGEIGPSEPSSECAGGNDVNDLEAPALAVEHRLGRWRAHIAGVTGCRPQLAGSGSTWFVEGTPDELGLTDSRTLRLGDERALVVPATTTPALP
jgi:4-diphosphocytidyl-2-C-methyl-D-erythritol kinase